MAVLCQVPRAEVVLELRGDALRAVVPGFIRKSRFFDRKSSSFRSKNDRFSDHVRAPSEPRGCGRPKIIIFQAKNLDNVLKNLHSYYNETHLSARALAFLPGT